MNKNNYAVIMAGGIGSRFWPMSKSACPKQFLDILGHEMVHHYQITHQQKCSGNHNSYFFKWKKKFEQMGLDLKVRY